MKSAKTNIPDVSNLITDTLQQKFSEKELNELKELYWFKLKLIKLLDLLIRKSYSEDLADVMEEYQVVLHRQARRLQDVFSILELKPESSISEIVKNQITDICGLIEELPAGYKRDSEMVAAILQMETYCLANNKLLYDFIENIHIEKAKTIFSEIQMESTLLISRFSFFSGKSKTVTVI